MTYQANVVLTCCFPKCSLRETHANFLAAIGAASRHRAKKPGHGRYKVRYPDASEVFFSLKPEGGSRGVERE